MDKDNVQYTNKGVVFSLKKENPAICSMSLKDIRLSEISVSVQSLSRVRLFATPWTAACQASLSITNSLSEISKSQKKKQ